MEELLRRLSSLNNDQIEEFINYVLIEIFNSVTEHGMPQKNKDEGWWMIAQHHQRHQFISLCIADNGIGIANSLYTGPQKAEIIKRIGGNSPASSGKAIELAIEKNISGAISAPR